MQKPSAAYGAVLRARAKTSRVYHPHQHAGLAIAEILHDRTHKIIYLGFARRYDNEWLMRLAKDIASRRGVRNRGAYFMRLLERAKRERKLPLRKGAEKKKVQLRLRFRKKSKRPVHR